MKATVLVVDDDSGFRSLVVDILGSAGYRLLEAETGEHALLVLARERVDMVLTDQRMPGIDGIDLVRRIRAASRPPAVVVMTAFGTIPQAVEAVRVGAADYLTKPLESPQALRRVVQRVLASQTGPPTKDHEFITSDPATLAVLAVADRAAATTATVLITGESGTGKELLARRIHGRSPRADGPFVAVNCAAIPESLAESELLGYEKGAFTGAESRRPGRFELASGGTLLLDEVGELPEVVQAKLLRVLEERVVERIGGRQPVPVDVRLVAATNRRLEDDVAAGRFRSDLYYRLDVVRLDLPPLRARLGDLDLLVPVLVEQMAVRLGVHPRPVAGAAMELLSCHSWPGNVRELRNVLERALIIGTGAEITARDIPSLGEGEGTTASAESPLSLRERERTAILAALERAGGHRERAAGLLGISVRTLYNRLREYDIR